MADSHPGPAGPLRRRSPILEALANLYATSKAGQSGDSARNFSVRFQRLLANAHCDRGDAYANALADLMAADGTALLLRKHRRSSDVQLIQIPVTMEVALFAQIGRISPAAERGAWTSLFHEAAEWPVPSDYEHSWRAFCQQRAELARRGERWSPLRRKHLTRARLQLRIITHLLGWRRPSLLRTVSAQLAGSSRSKFIERCRPTLEALLLAASGGRVRSLADLGISDNPREVRFHGPVRARLRAGSVDYAGHVGACSISEDDLSRSALLDCSALRCVTVENETTFHELCRSDCGDLFVLTSYPNRATVAFLRSLPASIQHFHFGDTDPWGFDVLRSLRMTLAPIEIFPLHMSFRPAPDAPPLTDRDRRKLADLLGDSTLVDVHEELQRMLASGTKGDFEQERLTVSGPFPYRFESTPRRADLD